MDNFRNRMRQLQVDSVTDFDGERIYLNRFTGGSELGIYVMDFVSGLQLRGLLENAFISALEFEGGLALSPDGNSLVLSQWLPNVSSWAAAESSLEKMLLQAEVLRNCEESHSPAKPASVASAMDEQRLRRKFISR